MLFIEGELLVTKKPNSNIWFVGEKLGHLRFLNEIGKMRSQLTSMQQLSPVCPIRTYVTAWHRILVLSSVCCLQTADCERYRRERQCSNVSSVAVHRTRHPGNHSARNRHHPRYSRVDIVKVFSMHSTCRNNCLFTWIRPVLLSAFVLFSNCLCSSLCISMSCYWYVLLSWYMYALHTFIVTATDVDSVTNSQLTYSVSDANFTVQTANNVGYIRTAQSVLCFIFIHFMITIK